MFEPPTSRSGCSACGSTASGCMSARPTRSARRKRRFSRAWRRASCHCRMRRRRRPGIFEDSGFASRRARNDGERMTPRATAHAMMPPDPRIRQPMRVFSVPLSVPFLRTVIAALIDGRLVEGFEARSESGKTCAKRRSICRPGAPGAWRGKSFSTRLKSRRRGAAAHRRARRYRRGRAGLRRGDRADTAARRRSTFRRNSASCERRLTLAQTGRGLGQGRPVLAPLVVGGPASTLALAGDLARLMDDMVTRGVDWEALDGLVPDQLDQYWQHSLQFLQIAREAWPDYLAEIGKIEPAARRDLLISAEAARLTAHHRRSGDRRRLDRLDADDGEIPSGGGRRCRRARWSCPDSTPTSTRKHGAASAASTRRRRESSRSIRHRTIRNLRCTRCCDRFGIKRHDVEILGAAGAAVAATCWYPKRCGRQTRRRNGIERLQQPDIAGRFRRHDSILP